MLCRKLALAFLFATAAPRLLADERVFLIGWAQFDGVSRAMISVLPGGTQLIVRSDHAVGGWRLLDLDIANRTAIVSHGVEQFTAVPPSISSSPSPAIGPRSAAISFHEAAPLSSAASAGAAVASPMEKLVSASGLEPNEMRPFPIIPVGNLRNQPQSTSASPSPPGLEQQNAGSSINSPSAIETPTPPQSAPNLALGSVEAASPDDALLRRIISSPPPGIGSFIGNGKQSDLAPIRRLVRITDDPSIRLRLLQQLDGYAAPPIGPYFRDSDGEWIDPTVAN